MPAFTIQRNTVAFDSALLTKFSTKFRIS